jgi:hypothetical protein
MTEARLNRQFSTDLKNLLTVMFQYEPGNRYSFEEIRGHPWYLQTAATDAQVFALFQQHGLA